MPEGKTDHFEENNKFNKFPPKHAKSVIFIGEDSNVNNIKDI